jgi:hypothetical protein
LLNARNSLHSEITQTIEANGDLEEEGERFIACYPYQSAEAGDLTFEIGEEVRVIKKEGDWWTGVIGNRVGIFPANYVQPATDNNDTHSTTLVNDFEKMDVNGSGSISDAIQATVAAAPPTTNNAMTAAEEADARNQADADSEVSQINTQNVANDVNMQEFRGMTSSAVSIFPVSLSLSRSIAI